MGNLINTNAEILPNTTDPAIGLTQNEADFQLKNFGYNEIKDNKPSSLLQFLSRFWGITSWMLELIILLFFLLHQSADAYIVLGLLFFNTIVGYIQEHKAAGAVAALRKKLQVSVKLLRDSIWRTEVARELVPGDIIRIRTGDFVPADIHIINGEISIDQSALTGESLEAEKSTGDTVFSGSIVTKGEATACVNFTGKATRFGKTIELVKIAKPLSHMDEVITKVVKWLLLIVSFLLLLALVAAIFEGINLLEMMPLMLVLLMGAIPVALTAMFTVCMALGAKELVRQGVLVTRLNAPEDAASMDILYVDKTGTLTMNKLSVAKILAAQSFTENDVLLFGVLASQEANHDAIDMALLNEAAIRKIDTTGFTQNSFTPFTPKNRKTEALVQHGNEVFSVMKGSFNVIAAACGFPLTLINEWNEKVNSFGMEGFRTLAVAKSVLNKPQFVGLVAMHDPPRPDSIQLINDLKNLGIEVKMLTGDALPIAVEVAKYVGIGDAVIQSSELKLTGKNEIYALLKKNNGVAEVFPKDKFEIVKAFQHNGHIVGMTGDGVNDAPALKQAEVGIAVSTATDVAKSAASIILTEEGLGNILAPVKVGRLMFERINIWILNKVARTILKTCFIVIAFLVLGRFIITATALLLLIFMTDFVKIALSTDNVTGSRQPAVWDINGLAKTGIVIGILMTLEAFGILYIGYHYFNLKADNQALNTFSFEILLFFAIFSIFVVREKKHFWNSAPSHTLLFLLIADLLISISFASFGILGFKAIPLIQSLTVFSYTAGCSFLINDQVKYLLFKMTGSKKNILHQ
jgi:H+-transporting ATPase